MLDYRVIPALVLPVLILVGIVGALFAARRDGLTHRLLRQLRSDQIALTARVIAIERNARRGKAYRDMHDLTEMFQFGFIKLRDFAEELRTVADTYAEHAARAGRKN